MDRRNVATSLAAAAATAVAGAAGGAAPARTDVLVTHRGYLTCDILAFSGG